MYDMHDLLELVSNERAQGLSLEVGASPVLIKDGENHQIEGPEITTESAESLLQHIADSRQRRELREHGKLEFVYSFRDSWKFLVRAKIVNGDIGLDIRIVAA